MESPSFHDTDKNKLVWKFLNLLDKAKRCVRSVTSRRSNHHWRYTVDRTSYDVNKLILNNLRKHKDGHAVFFVISQSQIRKFLRWAQIRKFLRWASPKSQVRKLVLINPQIANLQISLVSQSGKSKSANLQGKRQSFWSRSALVCFLYIFFYLHNYILDYEMPCLKNVPKSIKI